MYFFDLDGTLLDSNGIWLEIDVEFLGRHGIGSVPNDYTDYVTHHTFYDAAEYTKQYFQLSLTPEEIIAAWREMARQAYARQLELKPGARDFLERAAQAGRRCALLTSCLPLLGQAALDCHALSPLLAQGFTTAELGLEKWDPALYHQVARLCGVAEETCVLFDDSPVYCAAARDAGFQICGVPDPVFADRAAEMAALCGPNRFPFSFFQPRP
ncbi:MAG: HAD family phosphatase [Lawsonibacter sp.]|nr:HAD family phosphatase [Lawsonibacter sp.]